MTDTHHKLTLETLESGLWESANIMRGSIDEAFADIEAQNSYLEGVLTASSLATKTNWATICWPLEQVRR